MRSRPLWKHEEKAERSSCVSPMLPTGPPRSKVTELRETQTNQRGLSERMYFACSHVASAQDLLRTLVCPMLPELQKIARLTLLTCYIDCSLDSILRFNQLKNLCWMADHGILQSLQPHSSSRAAGVWLRPIVDIGSSLQRFSLHRTWLQPGL